MLRLGFDAKRLFHNFTGLGNYSRTLVNDLALHFPANEFHLFSPSHGRSSRTSHFSKAPFSVHTSGKSPSAYWRSYGIKKDLQKTGIDLYHGLSHEIPRGLKNTSIKSVVTIHDLVFKKHPKLFPSIDRKIYDWKFRYSCEHADAVVAISESTKKDIVKYYCTPEDRIKVIYQTCHSQFKQAVSEETIESVKKKYRLPKDFLLYVGAVIERKNLLGLVKAYRSLAPGIRTPLLIVGKGKSYEQKVRQYLQRHHLEKEVLFLENFDFLDLAAIYQLATALCYPSHYEGFGIPLIESLFCQTPVLTSNVSSLPEAAGPGACYVNPKERESILEGLEKLLSDQSYRDRLAKEGYDYVQQFHSKTLSAQMMSLYQKVLKE